MRAKVLSSAILACMPLIVSVGCTAKDNSTPAQKAQSTTTASNGTTEPAVNPTVSKSVASKSVTENLAV